MSLLSDNDFYTNMGLSLLGYSQPGPKQNLGQSLMSGLNNYYQMKAMKEEEERKKKREEREQSNHALNMYIQNKKMNDMAIQDEKQAGYDAAQRNYAGSFSPNNPVYGPMGLLQGASPNSDQANAYRMEQGLLSGDPAIRKSIISPPVPKLPNSVLEYEYALQNGFNGDYPNFLNTKKANTEVNVNLNKENQQPTNSTRSNIQKDLINIDDSIARFEDIGRLYNPEYLTNQGKAKAAVLKFADTWGVSPDNVPFIGKGGKDFLAGQTTHKQAVEQEFNVYRKEITGAAAAIAELDRLMKTFLNTDLSPTQYEASYSQILDKMKKAAQIKRDLLREGIPVGSEQFTLEHNKRYMGVDNNKNINNPPYPGIGGGKTAVRTGTYNGKKVIQYDDGSIDYAN